MHTIVARREWIVGGQSGLSVRTCEVHRAAIASGCVAIRIQRGDAYAHGCGSWGIGRCADAEMRRRCRVYAYTRPQTADLVAQLCKPKRVLRPADDGERSHAWGWVRELRDDPGRRDAANRVRIGPTKPEITIGPSRDEVRTTSGCG